MRSPAASLPSFDCRVLHAVRPASEATENAVLLRVGAPEEPHARAVPMLVALALDTSGSMEGDRVEAAMLGARALFSTLRSTDSACAVTFDDRSKTVFSLRPVTNPARMHEALSRVRPGGGTDLHAGLERAFRELMVRRTHAHLRRVVLVTDGSPSRGVARPVDFGDLLQAMARARVAVSCVGVGPEFDEGLLVDIAMTTGGDYVYVEEPKGLVSALERVGQELSQSVVADLMVSVRLLNRNRFARSADAARAAFRVPDLPAATEREILLRLSHDPRPQGDYVVAVIEVAGTDARLARPLEWSALPEVSFGPEQPDAPDARVRMASLAARAAELVADTARAIRLGQSPLPAVAARLREAQVLFAQGGRVQAARHVERVASDLDAGRARDPNKDLARVVLDVAAGRVDRQVEMGAVAHEDGLEP